MFDVGVFLGYECMSERYHEKACRVETQFNGSSLSISPLHILLSAEVGYA